MWSRLRAPALGAYSRSAHDLPSLVGDDDDVDEPTMGGGAAVRYLRSEPQDARGIVPFTLTAAGTTDAGRVRPSNEDALLVLPSHSVFAVADGMGGHAGGAVASELAVAAIATAFLDRVRAPSLLSGIPAAAGELVASFAAANEAIRCMAARDGRLSEMGTTIVAARFCPDQARLYVGHVGDSRCYRLRDGALEQVTRDHTLAELGFRGRESRHLSRAVGPHGVVEADVAVLAVRPGDVYLLCSDGLSKMVVDDTILDILAWEDEPASAARELVALANARGGRDNVTAVVIRVSAEPGSVST